MTDCLIYNLLQLFTNENLLSNLYPCFIWTFSLESVCLHWHLAAVQVSIYEIRERLYILCQMMMILHFCKLRVLCDQFRLERSVSFCIVRASLCVRSTIILLFTKGNHHLLLRAEVCYSQSKFCKIRYLPSLFCKIRYWPS